MKTSCNNSSHKLSKAAIPSGTSINVTQKVAATRRGGVIGRKDEDAAVDLVDLKSPNRILLLVLQ